MSYYTMGYLLNTSQALFHTSPSLQNRVEWSLPGAGVEEWEHVGQRVQTLCYDMNKFGGPNIEHGDHS